MSEQITARHDPALSATVVRHTPLYYRDVIGPGSERPPFVRAGSSLARLVDGLAVIQDDANYLALIDRNSVEAEALELPAGHGGHRVFDKDHADRGHKLDLEACATLPGAKTDLLVAFGSGSQPSREWVIIVDWQGGGPTTALYHAHALYDAVRREHVFAGSELNIEGAVFVGPHHIRLFQRGNGKPRGDLQPVDATGDLDWPALKAYLEQPERIGPPPLSNVVQYRLGELDGVRLTFSDAELVGDVMLFSASAEDSGDAGRDGRIAGSVLGVIDNEGARWARLVGSDGGAFKAKIEGLSLAPDDPHHAYFVTDDDDADAPSELFEARLDGPWYLQDSGPA